MQSILLLIPPLLLTALYLLYRGIRGKRINNHPICRKCKFDLVGAPEPATTCPECGADLSRKRAKRTGARRRRPRSIIAGAALLTLLLAASAAWLYTTRTANWAAGAPTPILSLAARIGLSTDITADALEELCLRLENDELSKRQIDALVERGLDIQADKSIEWEPLWGRLIQGVLFSGMGNEDWLKRYSRNAIEFTDEIRSPVRSGDPLMCYVEYKPVRAYRSFFTTASTRGAPAYGSVKLEMRPISTSVGGVSHPIEAPEVIRHEMRIIGYGVVINRQALSNYRNGLENEYVTIDSSPGPTTVVNTYRISASVFDGRQVESVEWVESIKHPLEVLPKSADPARLVVSDEYREEIMRFAESIRVRTDHVSWPELGYLAFRLRNEVPIALSFDVLVQPAGGKWDLVARADGMILQIKDVAQVSNPLPRIIVHCGQFPDNVDHVDLKLVPNPEYAAKTLRVHEIWGEPIVLRNVPVEKN